MIGHRIDRHGKAKPRIMSSAFLTFKIERDRSISARGIFKVVVSSDSVINQITEVCACFQNIFRIFKHVSKNLNIGLFSKIRIQNIRSNFSIRTEVYCSHNCDDLSSTKLRDAAPNIVDTMKIYGFDILFQIQQLK